MKNINYSDLKGKPMFGFVGLLIAFILILWPQPRSGSQPDTNPIAPEQNIVDSLAYLRELNARKDDRNLSETRELVVMTKQLNKHTRKKANINEEILKPTVVLRYGGEIYEPEIEMYKNYFIVDIDSFLSDVNTIIEAPAMNEFIDTSFYEPKPKRPWWKIWKR